MNISRRVGALLFVSGACSLVFQTAWFREFGLVFGASTLASSAVLAIFMGGLGLGNAWLGRLADRTDQPLKLYAKLELAISLLCAISPFLLVAVRAIYVALGGQESLGIWGATIARVIGAAIVIAAPTFLMGGTLPAAVRAVTSVGDRGRHSVGWLYGCNTLGAVLGVIVGTFLLLEWLGIRGTLWLACVVNLSNSSLAFYLAGKLGAASTEATLSHSIPSQAQPAELSPRFCYLAAGTIGFVFFLMELVWYRMLAPILGGSTFTFGLILAVALAGIGLGGAVYPWLFRRRAPTLYSFIATLGLEALAITVPLALGDRIAVLALTIRDLSLFGFAGSVLGWTFIASIVVFPAALVSGVQFPVLVALLGQGRQDVGKQLGQAFGWNTLGSMLGSLAGGFGLMTLLSATGVWRLAVQGLVIFAVALLVIAWFGSRQPLKTFALAGVLLLAAYLSTATGPSEVWRHGGIGAGRTIVPKNRNQLLDWQNETRRKIVWQGDGRESSVAIDSKSSFGFLVNGKSDGNAVGDAGTQIMLGVLPAILHPEPKSGFVVGLGTGESAGWLASLPSIQRVDVVELEPSVTQMAMLCAPFNHDVLNHPKVNLVFNDAREQLQTTRWKYDVIASEPSNPYRSGVSSLYTREFYRVVSERLNERGIFSQWLQGYEVNTTTIGTVLKTLKSVFSYVEMWQTQGGDMVMVCSQSPLAYMPSSLAERLRVREVAEAANVAWKSADVDGVISHLIAGNEFVDALVTQPEYQVNTDDRNSLEYAFARTVGSASGFTIEQVREQANELSLRWPKRFADAIDPTRASDHAIGLSVFLTRSVSFLSSKLSPRAQVWQAIQEDRTSDAISLWDTINEPPRDLTEMLLVGLAYANARDQRLPKILDQIATLSPADAAGLACIPSAQVGDSVQTMRALTRFFGLLRQTPVVSEPLLLRGFLIAEAIAQRDPAQGPELMASLQQPFSLYLANDRRIATLINIAQAIGPIETTNVLLSLEPNPIWTREALNLRYKAYQTLKHPLAPTAARDIAIFEQYADRPLFRAR